METLTQQGRTILVSTPKSYASTACTAAWISMRNYDRIRFVIPTGAWAGGTAAVTFKQAINVSGSSSAALTFANHYVGTGEVQTKTTTTSNTFNLAAASTKYMVEIRASQLSAGMKAVKIIIATPGANADFYCVLAECYFGRYKLGSASPAATT